MLHIRSLKDLDINTLQKDANDFVEQYLEKKKIDEGHNILKNYDKNDVILVKGKHEAIISEEVFDQVHNIVTNHLDDFAKITFDVEADHKVKVEISEN